jgi:hypothetical protein
MEGLTCLMTEMHITGNVVDYECACERNGIQAISHEMLVFKSCGKLEEKSVVS